MKKLAIIFLIVSCLAIVPAAASAMTYMDFLSYGQRWLKIGEKKPVPAPVSKEVVNRSLPVDSLAAMNAKHRLWEEAYKAKNISGLFQDKSNFKISESEINYFSRQAFDTASSSVVRNLKIDFAPGLIKISGYSLVNSLKGDFYAEMKVLSSNGRVYPKVTKARYGKMWIPAFVVDNLVKRETKDLVDFLYSDKDHQDLKIVIDDNSLELKYEP